MILIIDFGSQVTQLIARRIRNIEVYSVVISYQNAINYINANRGKILGIIFSGGPNSVYEKGAPTIDKIVFDLNIPILGICYGQQLICHLLGGRVEKSEKKEYGIAKLKFIKQSVLLEDIFSLLKDEYPFQVLMSHGDSVSEIPNDFEVIGQTENCPFAIIENEKLKIYGIQFHPEVTHSIIGNDVLKNFVLKICNCTQNWKMDNYMNQMIKKIKMQIGDGTAICALSGGVDSFVAAELVRRAIGDNLKCIFVDTGLMRKNEGEEVKKMFQNNLIYVDAKDRFLSSLKNIIDPEGKRKIIGKLFIDIFNEEAQKMFHVEHFNKPKFLVQGTIYPDVIESANISGTAHTIKSHHNVGGLPKEMDFALVEPLRDLFKDEVRKLGEQLNIDILNDFISNLENQNHNVPRGTLISQGIEDERVRLHSRIWRHPFPGPGLAIRIIGEITEEKVKILQEADAIYIEELRNANLYDKIWQAFCVLTNTQTVGVMGDARTYEYVLAIRAVTSIDGMTADFYQFDMAFLQKLSSRLTNEVGGISRIVYDITSKPPSTIEWE